MDNIRHFGNTKPQKLLAVKEMAAHYRMSLENIGGNRRTFLQDEQNRHISKNAPQWYKDKSIAIMSLLMAGIVCYVAFKLITEGVTFTSIVSVILVSAGALLHTRNVRIWQRTEQKKLDIRRGFARYFEPEELWAIDYPVHGEKGELITAILAARKYLSLLESATTMPVCVPKRDPHYVNMIQTIIEAKEEDIHPYLYDEINYLCESTREYVKIYGSLISLDVEMRTENL